MLTTFNLPTKLERFEILLGFGHDEEHMNRSVRVLILCTVVLASWQSLALAAPFSTSANYGITEQNIGIGGDITSNSTSYSALGSTLGDTAVGNSTSNSYQTNSGLVTAQEPQLGLVINTSTINFGVVTPGTQVLGTATFSVLNYTSYGCVVTVMGTAPNNGVHTISSLTTDTAYNASLEQFGINLVRNVVAATGADPVQNPSSSFSYGAAGDGATGTYGTTRPYTISDKWRFVSGETIAYAPKSSGETDFTTTFMMNTLALTPSGQYAGNFNIIATGTY